MDTKTLKSWSDFLEVTEKLDVEELHKVNYIYRGQSDISWDLKSSFHRSVDLDELSASDLIGIEKELLSKFKTQAHQFLPNSVIDKTTDIVGWWGLMQHYGAPTRLIDWSLSPFIAAYNACVENFETEGVIWVLHVYSLNQKMRSIEGYKEYPKVGPAKVESFFFDTEAPSIIFTIDRTIKTDRMVYQQGVFSVTQNITDIQEDVISNALPDNDGETKLIKIIIPVELKIEFLKKLHKMNVSANSLFPGIDGLGKSISEYMKILASEWKGI